MKYSYAFAFVAALGGVAACSSDPADDGDGTGGTGAGVGGTGAGVGGTGAGVGGTATGTGGTGTGTGGAGTGGSGTPDGEFVCEGDFTAATAKPAACASELVPIAQIQDFETDALGWGLYRNTEPDDEVGETTPAFAESVVTSAGGPTGSTMAVSYESTVDFTRGVRLNVGYGTVCQDVRTFTGLTFWAKGVIEAEAAGGWDKPANTLVVIMGTPGATAATTDFQFEITDEWTQYAIPFNCFGPDEAKTFQGYLSNIEFHARGPSFSIAIDQVAYY